MVVNVTDQEILEFNDKCIKFSQNPFYVAYCIECGFKSINEARIKLCGKGVNFTDWLHVFNCYRLRKKSTTPIYAVVFKLKEKGLFDSVDAFLSGG